MYSQEKRFPNQEKVLHPITVNNDNNNNINQNSNGINNNNNNIPPVEHQIMVNKLLKDSKFEMNSK